MDVGMFIGQVQIPGECVEGDAFPGRRRKFGITVSV